MKSGVPEVINRASTFAATAYNMARAARDAFNSLLKGGSTVRKIGEPGR